MRVDYAKLLEIARSKRYVCAEQRCELYDRCPRHFPFDVNVDAWLARNCPKVKEAAEGA